MRSTSIGRAGFRYLAVAVLGAAFAIAGGGGRSEDRRARAPVAGGTIGSRHGADTAGQQTRRSRAGQQRARRRGTIGLAQLINNYKGDGGALMVSGKGMVSAIFIQKSPLTLSNATPIARLTGEYEVLVVAPIPR